MPNKQYIFNWN